LSEIVNPLASAILWGAMRLKLGPVLEILQIVVLAGLAILITRQFIVLPFIVRGRSMEPSFYENEYLIVDELSYHFREPQRGEIVVFRPVSKFREGGVDGEHSREHYIKRVIGLPGETVEIKDRRITLYNEEYPNGTVLAEPYLDDLTPGDSSDYVTLGPDEYYMMGDNRDKSLDSRVIGPQPRSAIVGRVLFRGLPLDRAELFLSSPYGQQ
jgi:signal peptidase I